MITVVSIIKKLHHGWSLKRAATVSQTSSTDNHSWNQTPQTRNRIIYLTNSFFTVLCKDTTAKISQHHKQRLNKTKLHWWPHSSKKKCYNNIYLEQATPLIILQGVRQCRLSVCWNIKTEIAVLTSFNHGQTCSTNDLQEVKHSCTMQADIMLWLTFNRILFKCVQIVSFKPKP